jgi:DNA topoisomerase IB
VALIRVGNEEYAKHNDSFGLTTMRDQHVHVNGSAVRFEFRGKSGIVHTVDLKDRRLARIVRRSRDLPGYELFQHIDGKGVRRAIDAVCRKCYVHPDVLNAYLEGSLADMLSRSAGRELRSKLHDMPPEEAAVLALLYQRFQRDRRLVRV